MQAEIENAEILCVSDGLDFADSSLELWGFNLESQPMFTKSSIDSGNADISMIDFFVFELGRIIHRRIREASTTTISYRYEISRSRFLSLTISRDRGRSTRKDQTDMQSLMQYWVVIF